MAIEDADLMWCSGPRCKFVYHITCRGLFEKPKNAWFCDNDCRRNAGFRVVLNKAKQKKQQKVQEEGGVILGSHRTSVQRLASQRELPEGASDLRGKEGAAGEHINLQKEGGAAT
ncbi:hypothetical protein CPB84DRAFT_1748133 [Gymnopilus junonius]|uniref:Zinc finger PHD-type domain-containing protein n=1 Tax=Gymnopilus junonius TaxID=109634 RepID=A0A9P5NM47_GYMJU|nr:hypothetical protein CPB84DRAFT_1748133 [Gymnopilus junonius]